MLVSRTVLSIKQYIRLAKSSFFPNHLMDFSIRWFGKKLYKLFGQPNIKHLEQHPACGPSIDAQYKGQVEMYKRQKLGRNGNISECLEQQKVFKYEAE